MSDYRIWARVEHVGVRQFVAIVSAVPDEISERPIVLTSIAPSLAEADQHRDRLAVEAGERVRALAARVVDVEC